jgi:hypothetical protein
MLKRERRLHAGILVSLSNRDCKDSLDGADVLVAGCRVELAKRLCMFALSDTTEHSVNCGLVSSAIVCVVEANRPRPHQTCRSLCR